MDYTVDKFEKDFNCDLKGISAMLDACMAYVDQQEEHYPEIKGVRARLKWTITELLTNAIKHSGAPVCRIKMGCDATGLVLEKAEQGKPLTLTNSENGVSASWPLGASEKQVFEIYQNGADSLWIDIAANGDAIFRIRPVVDVEMPMLSEHIAEHFGLLILTKASDLFTYEYQAADGTNLFRCHFNWSKK